MNTIEVYLNQNDIEKVLDAVLDALDASTYTAEAPPAPEPDYSREELLAAAVFEQTRALGRVARELEEAGIDPVVGREYTSLTYIASQLVAARIQAGDL